MSHSSNSRYSLFKKSRLAVDLSPMIDLVFLLLIFFMITFQRVREQHDPNVRVPIASGAVVGEDSKDRLVLNVYADGSVYDQNRKLLTLTDVTAFVETEKLANPNLRLHLRADRETEHENVKKVIDAVAQGGIKDVIFSTEQ